MDWSSDVCSSDLNGRCRPAHAPLAPGIRRRGKHALGTYHPVGGAIFVRRTAHFRLYGDEFYRAGDHALRHARAKGSSPNRERARDRKTVVQGKRVSVSVDFGVLLIIKKKQ